MPQVIRMPFTLEGHGVFPSISQLCMHVIANKLEGDLKAVRADGEVFDVLQKDVKRMRTPRGANRKGEGRNYWGYKSEVSRWQVYQEATLGTGDRYDRKPWIERHTEDRWVFVEGEIEI